MLPQITTATNLSVGTDSALALASKEMRKKAIISNDSDTTVYLNFNSAASTGKGIAVASNEIFETDFRGNIYAIATATSKNIAILDLYGDSA